MKLVEQSNIHGEYHERIEEDDTEIHVFSRIGPVQWIVGILGWDWL